MLILRERKEALTLWNRRRVRTRFARRYLSGEGVEIGALHQPQPLPAGANAKYLDRLDTPALRREYPELDHLPLVEVDIVEDGEDPKSIEDESLDFLIASHVIEHTEDPVGTIANWLRVLRPGGHLFLVVPDRRRTFDRSREPQDTAHLLRDHREGPETSRRQHYREWVDATSPDEPDPDRLATDLEKQGYRIHFHVWTAEEFEASLIEIAETENLPLRISGTGRNYREFIVVLEKAA